MGLEGIRHLIDLDARDALKARGVDDGELALLVGGAEVAEEVEGGVDDPVGPGAVAVDLVDDDDHLLVERERLLQDESGLGHRALDGVDEEEDAVDHVEDALDLTAEVSVSRCVDDVDLGVLVRHSGVLGEDGDAALALEIVAVHDARLDLLVLAEDLGLREHRVDEGGLAVVDVRDDGDVADVVALLQVRRRRLGLRDGLGTHRHGALGLADLGGLSGVNALGDGRGDALSGHGLHDASRVGRVKRCECGGCLPGRQGSVETHRISLDKVKAATSPAAF